MKEIIFLGAKTVGYNCLKYLVENSKDMDIHISGVLTNSTHMLSKELNIHELCAANKIPVINSLDKLLEQKDVDFLISVQYNNILKKQHIQKAKQLAVNLHMAPLPEYRGCNQFSFALIEQKPEFGTTFHVLDESIDGGDILFEKRYPIPEHCFVDDLYERTVKESVQLFKDKINLIFQGKYTRIAQSSLVESRGISLHYRKEIEKLKIIDLSWKPEKIERYVRATYFPPFNPPYAIVNGTKIFLSCSKEKILQPVNH